MLQCARLQLFVRVESPNWITVHAADRRYRRTFVRRRIESQQLPADCTEHSGRAFDPVPKIPIHLAVNRAAAHGEQSAELLL